MRHRLAATLFSLTLLAPMAAWPQVSVAINIRPPPLPVYVQPPLPAEGYIWTPGYWGWSPSDNDFYWVPGTWVLAPTPGHLWTPGYWGFYGGNYRWNRGYWGTQVGFYGGINYGYGYGGSGYQGGRWERGAFYYNQSVNNVNKTVVRNVYNTTVVNNYNVKRVSFNGGPEGVKAEPSARERQEDKARHIDPTPNQVEHERTAMKTPAQKASVNRGSPQLAATQKAAEFDAPVGGRDPKPVRAKDDDSSAPQRQDGNATRANTSADEVARPADKQARPAAQSDEPSMEPKSGTGDRGQNEQKAQQASRDGNQQADQPSRQGQGEGKEPKGDARDQGQRKQGSQKPPQAHPDNSQSKSKGEAHGK